MKAVLQSILYLLEIEISEEVDLYDLLGDELCEIVMDVGYILVVLVKVEGESWVGLDIDFEVVLVREKDIEYFSHIEIDRVIFDVFDRDLNGNMLVKQTETESELGLVAESVREMVESVKDQEESKLEKSVVRVGRVLLWGREVILQDEFRIYRDIKFEDGGGLQRLKRVLELIGLIVE